MNIPDPLNQAVATAKQKGTVSCTPRQLLQWYGYSRRGSWISANIRKHLKKLAVRTEPDFEAVWIDVPIQLTPIPPASADSETDAKPVPEIVAPPRLEATEVAASHRISRLEAANVKPVSVKPSDDLTTAVTLMMSYDFSQLPVMTSEREVKGIVSWRSIGNRLVLKQRCQSVRDCMEPHHEVRETASMFDVIRLLAQHECVLVRNGVSVISGIVTASDISEQFQVISEPFILLGDIENDLRRLIERAFTIEEIRRAHDAADESRAVDSAADLSFGEYVRLLENPESWTKLKLPLDRVVFIKNLQEVRKIRNNIMHFDPDGIDDKDQRTLRQFAAFMERLEALTKDA